MRSRALAYDRRGACLRCAGHGWETHCLAAISNPSPPSQQGREAARGSLQGVVHHRESGPFACRCAHWRSCIPAGRTPLCETCIPIATRNLPSHPVSRRVSPTAESRRIEHHFLNGIGIRCSQKLCSPTGVPTSTRVTLPMVCHTGLSNPRA